MIPIEAERDSTVGLFRLPGRQSLDFCEWQLSELRRVHRQSSERDRENVRVKIRYKPKTVTSSRTEADDFCNAAFSSAVNLIWTISSAPLAPSFTGTPTKSPLIPYSPSRYTAQGKIF